MCLFKFKQLYHIIIMDGDKMAWESNQYLKFEKERTQPSKDLISRLDYEYKNILDLGCGPANSTYQLLLRFKNAKIIGFEADSDMLDKAKKLHPEFEYIKGFAPDDLIGKYDLVLLDEELSQISGAELLMKIKEIRNFKTPIILLTKDNSYEYNEESEKLGFADYLLKPLKKEDLLAKIDKYTKKDK